MNAPQRQGISYRPADPAAIEREQRWSFIRACTAIALSAADCTRSVDKILRGTWPDDVHAEMITRGAVAPTTTANYLRIDQIRLLTSLAPRSAASRLFELAQPVDLSGITSALFPLPSALPDAAFVGEGAPIPVIQGTIGAGMRIGPPSKLALIAGLTEELEQASGQTASVVIERLLEVTIGRSLDKALFSANAATAISPPGLLYGVAPLPAGATMTADLQSLVEAIAAGGYDPEAVAFIASPGQALALRLVAGPQFAYKIIGTNGLPAKSVVAVDASALVSASSGAPEVSATKNATLHFFDPAAPLVDNAAALSAPQRSLWQTGTLALRVISRVSWAVAPGALAWTTGVTW